MGKSEKPAGDQVNVNAGTINASNGATVGIDKSEGKQITAAADPSSPFGFLSFAIKKLPLLKWAVGVGGIVAVVAIVALFNLPPAVAIFGTLAVFIGMFGLVIFAALVQPPTTRRKPPLLSQIVLWCFGGLIVISGFLTASSVFFDWPIPLHQLILPGNQRAHATPTSTVPFPNRTLGYRESASDAALTRGEMFGPGKPWGEPSEGVLRRGERITLFVVEHNGGEDGSLARRVSVMRELSDGTSETLLIAGPSDKQTSTFRLKPDEWVTGITAYGDGEWLDAIEVHTNNGPSGRLGNKTPSRGVRRDAPEGCRVVGLRLGSGRSELNQVGLIWERIGGH